MPEKPTERSQQRRLPAIFSFGSPSAGTPSADTTAINKQVADLFPAPE
jgi:hypothetical protein